jgi:hypothetical protein
MSTLPQIDHYMPGFIILLWHAKNVTSNGIFSTPLNCYMRTSFNFECPECEGTEHGNLNLRPQFWLLRLWRRSVISNRSSMYGL